MCEKRWRVYRELYLSQCVVILILWGWGRTAETRAFVCNRPHIFPPKRPVFPQKRPSCLSVSTSGSYVHMASQNREWALLSNHNVRDSCVAVSDLLNACGTMRTVCTTEAWFLQKRCIFLVVGNKTNCCANGAMLRCVLVANASQHRYKWMLISLQKRPIMLDFCKRDVCLEWLATNNIAVPVGQCCDEYLFWILRNRCVHWCWCLCKRGLWRLFTSNVHL